MRISDWSSDVCSSDLAITLADDNAFVGLHALTRTFDNVYIDDNGIARAKYGFGFAAGKARDFFLFNSFNQVHSEHSRFHLDAGVFLCNCATTTVTGMLPN